MFLFCKLWNQKSKMNDLSLDLFIVFLPNHFPLIWCDKTCIGMVIFAYDFNDFMVFHEFSCSWLGELLIHHVYSLQFQHPYLVTKYTPNRAKWKNTFSSYKLSNFIGSSSISFSQEIVHFWNTWNEGGTQLDFRNQ